MFYKELLEIIEDMSDSELDRDIIIESELIGLTKDVEFDRKSLTMIAYEQ
tara:strand:+ start:2485 stop:2634 length:150 start_codon:yes stop_codon:yes gene_type:complete